MSQQLLSLILSSSLILILFSIEVDSRSHLNQWYVYFLCSKTSPFLISGMDVTVPSGIPTHWQMMIKKSRVTSQTTARWTSTSCTNWENGDWIWDCLEDSLPKKQPSIWSDSLLHLCQQIQEDGSDPTCTIIWCSHLFTHSQFSKILLESAFQVFAIVLNVFTMVLNFFIIVLKVTDDWEEKRQDLIKDFRKIDSGLDWYPSAA